MRVALALSVAMAADWLGAGSCWQQVSVCLVCLTMQLRWKYGGRKVCSAHSHLGGKITKSATAVPVIWPSSAAAELRAAAAPAALHRQHTAASLSMHKLLGCCPTLRSCMRASIQDANPACIPLTWHRGGTGEDSEDAGVGMVHPHSVDGAEQRKVIDVGHVVAVPGHHIEGGVALLGLPQLPPQLVDERVLLPRLLAAGCGGPEVPGIGQTIGTCISKTMLGSACPAGEDSRQSPCTVGW